MITIQSQLIVGHYLSVKDGDVYIDVHPVLKTHEGKNGGHAESEIIVHTEKFSAQQLRDGVRVHDVLCAHADDYQAHLQLIDDYGTLIATFTVSVTNVGDAAIIWFIPSKPLVGIHQLPLKTYDKTVNHTVKG